MILVHGVGEQARGDILTDWGNTLVRTLRTVTSPEAVVVTDVVGVGADGEGATATAVVDFPTTGDKPWLLAEALWADRFASPTFRQLALWSFKVLPLTVALHFAGRAGQTHSATSDAAQPLKRALLYFDLVVGNVLRFAVVLLAAPIVLALMVVMGVMALLPVASVRSSIARIQRRLAGTVGDSLVLLESPVEAAAITSAVRNVVTDLAESCDRLAIVAHSQGAAVALQAIKPDDRGEASVNRQQIDTIVTFGAGINKLVALRSLLTPRDQLSASLDEPLSDGEFVPMAPPGLQSRLWRATAYLYALLVVGAVTWIRWASGEVSGRDALYVVAAVIAGYIVFGAFMLVQSAVMRTDRPRRAAYVIVAETILVPVIAGVLWFSAGPLVAMALLFSHLGFRLVQFLSVLPLAVLSTIDAPVPTDTRLWLDIYASSDPVPSGEIRTENDRFPESVETWNLGSPIADHSAYWKNVDGFVVLVLAALADAAGSSLAARLPLERLEGVHRSRLRVRWLSVARFVVAAAAVFYVGVHATRVQAMGSAATRRVADLLSRLPIDLGAWIPDDPRRGAARTVFLAFVAVGTWLAYAGVKAVWWSWVHADHKRALRPNNGSVLRRRFWAFLLAVSAVPVLAWLLDATAVWLDGRLAGEYQDVVATSHLGIPVNGVWTAWAVAALSCVVLASLLYWLAGKLGVGVLEPHASNPKTGLSTPDSDNGRGVPTG